MTEQLQPVTEIQANARLAIRLVTHVAISSASEVARREAWEVIDQALDMINEEQRGEASDAGR